MPDRASRLAVTHNLPGGRRGRVLALGILACLAGALWLGAAAPLLGWYEARDRALQDQRELLAHMRSVAERLPAARRQAAAQPADGTDGLLDGGSDAVATAELQERLERLAGPNGVRLSSVESLPPLVLGTMHAAGLRVAGQASWPDVARLLLALDQARPALLVDGLMVHAAPGGGDMAVNFTLLGFHGPRPAPGHVVSGPAAQAERHRS